MHDFRYKNGELCCEDVRLSGLAERFGTPLYVYSHKTVIDHYLKLKRAFAPVHPLICFSVKSNSNLSILRALVKKGAGLDIVSGGELYRAKKVGVDPQKIVYASVGKTRYEIEEAIKTGILFFNVESLEELISISEVAQRLRQEARVCIRVNPDIEAHTHRYITTGTLESKFGVDVETARIIFLNRLHFKSVKILGLHVHIGSQIVQSGPYLAALRRLFRLMGELRRIDARLEWLNIGGGLGIIYKDEKPQTADDFARSVLPFLRPLGVRVILEPGRFIVGNAGVLLARVIYVKDTPNKRFVIVDAGMNDLIRPSLYEAHHEILPLMKREEERGKRREERGERRKEKKADVVGPICESGDFLARDRVLPAFESGELLAVMSAGAYGFSMASNYNSRCRPAEVLVKGRKAYLVRSRETLADLTRLDKIIEL